MFKILVNSFFIGNGFAPASLILKKLTSSTLTAYTPTTTTVTDEHNDFGDFESRGESLLTLVEPELDNLSRHWLAALKDHALLLLPSEYSSQLPHDGGAFYTNDTMNSSKPHYLTAWPSILYAASLWLNSTKFEMNSETEHLDNAAQQQSSTLNNNPIGHGSISADRFHLIFGISMEAICSTRSNEKLDSIISCLQSIYTVFDCEWARQQIFVDKSLAVELCNILHRQILTRDSLDVQLLCIEILKRTIQGAKEHLDRQRQEKQTSNEADGETDTGGEAKTETSGPIDAFEGEGGENGNIIPGQSHVYAVLEVCLCLFVRQIPTMNPSTNIKLTTEHLQNQLKISRNGTSTLGEDNGMLVASALQSLENLTQLCTPQGALQILPTILYLATSIIKEIATKSHTDSTIIANTGTMQAALHCLKTVAIDKYAMDEGCTAQWKKLLQAALASIIDLSKTGCDETKVDEVTIMLAIAIFILHAPDNLVSTPSLKFPCINHFQQCLQNENNFMIKLKCIQTMRSIFVNADLKVATPYIHALAPRMIEGLYTPNAKYPKNDVELSIILESITTVETLISLAEPQNRK